MQSTLGHLSRLVSRSLVTGVVNKDANATTTTTTASTTSAAAAAAATRRHSRLVTAVSGFPKGQLTSSQQQPQQQQQQEQQQQAEPQQRRRVGKKSYNIDNILNGQIGDDAYFVARHVDDWDNDAENASARCAGADVIGVADGVGGWRQYGVDPGQFSSQLMYNCERLVRAGYFAPTQPARLLGQGYKELQECKSQVIGSSTACVMVLDHTDSRLYTANIGDSGFLVVRNGQVVHRSREQQHSFNTPFQLSLPPSEMASDVLVDQPESADRYEFRVEDGDVILLATDGIFDNVPTALLVDQISANVTTASGNADLPSSSSLDRLSTPLDDSDSNANLQSEEEYVRSCEEVAVRLQQCANSIALIARKLSQDPNFLSPFAKNARANGLGNVKGGKEDDITVLLAAVKIQDTL